MTITRPAMAEVTAPRRESALLRRMAHWGALSGPRAFVRYSPGLIGAAFMAVPDVRRQVIGNLRRIYGVRSAWREQLDAAETLASYASCFAEAIASARSDVKLNIHLIHPERMHESLRAGGVVTITAHVGPWELTGQMLRPDLDVEAVVVMGREANEESRQLQDRLRNERGMRVLHIGDHATDALPLIAHLKEGGLAAMQLDRVPPSGRVLDVSLFGQPFRVPEGPFRLASLSGAAVVPVFARRLGFFDYELEVSEPIRLGRRPKPEEFLRAAQTATDAMQAFVRCTPTQWFHFPREERGRAPAHPGPAARDTL